MHYFDIITLAVLGFLGFMGFRRGLVTELFKLVGIVAAILAAIQFGDAGTAVLGARLEADQSTLAVMSYVLIFFVTLIIVRVAAIIIKGIMQFAMMNWLDRSGGALFGALKGAVILSGVLWAITILPMDKFTNDIEAKSKSYPYLKGFAPKVYDAVFRVIPGSNSFAEKLQEFIPAGKSMGPVGQFGNEDIIKQLEDELGGKFDPQVLKEFKAGGLSDEVKKLLKENDIDISEGEPGSTDRFSQEQKEKLEQLLEKYKSESGDELPGIP
ncbi:MAG: CvpA family protein [Candidatus Marinimicrobia bacterium]|nr:CvpA family protein [Candidatus Neomarinimicrobiota bacterium]MCF7829441.1 CvpA family protein [Candidatus Neomarinimicrobiota bacterium]MCF7880927.1 CvpA family protein [Candidatus Neomarinimicrobiota bacterium]